MKLAAFYCVNYLQDTTSLLLINVNEIVSPRTIYRQGEFLLAIYWISDKSFLFYSVKYIKMQFAVMHYFLCILFYEVYRVLLKVITVTCSFELIFTQGKSDGKNHIKCIRTKMLGT